MRDNLFLRRPSKHSITLLSDRTLTITALFGRGLESEFSLKLQKPQDRAARIITFFSYDSISAPCSKSLDWTGSLYAELIDRNVQGVQQYGT